RAEPGTAVLPCGDRAQSGEVPVEIRGAARGRRLARPHRAIRRTRHPTLSIQEMWRWWRTAAMARARVGMTVRSITSSSRDQELLDPVEAITSSANRDSTTPESRSRKADEAVAREEGSRIASSDEA